ncbi:MAG: hypothetical protein AB8H47_05805 [Bacteroidia bacterium]
MRRLNVLLILALLIFGRLEILSAQQARHAPWLDLWFLQARFSESDKNRDQQLSYSEMETFPEEWAYFLVDEFFTEADLNQDGFLNETETWRRLGTAHQYRVKLDAALVAELREKYPFFDDAKLVYFKRHPELTAELFKNLSWLRLHPDIPYKLLANSSWWGENPDVLQALSRNITGLAEQPTIALRLYELSILNRYIGPDRGFRAGYKNLFIERKREQAYAFRISFYDEEIPNQQLEGAPIAATDTEGKTDIKLSLPPNAAGLQQEVEQLEAELLSLIQRLQKENKVLKSAETLLQEQIDALNQALSEAAKRPDQNALLLLQRKVAELTMAKSRLETELNQAVFAQRETQVDGSTQMAQIEDLKGQVLKLEEENIRMQRVMSSNTSGLRQANVAQETQIRQLQGVISKMGNQLDQINTTDNSAEIARYQSRIQALQASLQTSNQDLEHVRKSWTETAQTLAEANQERQQLKASLRNLEVQQMVKSEQLTQSLENQQLDQAQYKSLIAENQKQKLEITRLNGAVSNLEQSVLSKASIDETQVRKELEAKYIANFQKQMSRSDSLYRLNQELAQQVDDLQFQFVQMEMNQANTSESTEASLERLEQYYQKQSQTFKAEIAALKQQNLQLAQQNKAVPTVDPNQAAVQEALASENEKIKMQLARQSESLQATEQLQSNINSLSQEVQSLTAERDASLAENQRLLSVQNDPGSQQILEVLQEENIRLKQKLAEQKQNLSQAEMELASLENQKLEEKLQSLSLVRDSALAENNRLLRMNNLQEEQIASMQSQLSVDNRRAEAIANDREQEYRNRIVALEGKLADQNQETLDVSKELAELKLIDKDLSLAQQAQQLEIKRLQAAQDSLMKENFALIGENEAQASQIAQVEAKQETSQLRNQIVAERQEAARVRDSALAENNRLLRMNSLQEEQIASMQSQLSVDNRRAEAIANEREQEYRNRIVALEGKLANQNQETLDANKELAQLKLKDKDLSLAQQAQQLEVKRLQAAQDSLMKENFALIGENEAQASQIAQAEASQETSQLKTQMVAEQQEASLRINKLEILLKNADSLVTNLSLEHETQIAQLNEYKLNQSVLLEENDRLTLTLQKQIKKTRELEQDLTISTAARESFASSSQSEALRVDTIEKQLLVLQMEKELGREVEDSLMARSQRQRQFIRTLEQERDTLVKSIRDRDRVIESYVTRMHLQKDSLAQLLSLQNRAYSAMNDEKSNGLTKIDQLHHQIQSLEYENEKLSERVNEVLIGEDQLRLKMAKLEAHNLVLEGKNKDLAARKRRKEGQSSETGNVVVQLETLETEKRNLAIEKSSLQEQLLSLESFIGQIRQSETQLKREVQVQKALNSRLDNQVDSLEQAIDKFHSYNWPDSVDYYRNQLLYARASTENQRGMAIASDLNNQRQKDSLRQEIMRIEEVFAQRENNSKIDQQRIKAIERQEQELEADRKVLAKREQLIRQQSRMIEDRLKALSDLEDRYLDVLEREKELQMLEQYLKQQDGYKEAKKDWRRSQEE